MKNIITAIELSLKSENFYAALALALSSPDICGWIENPNLGSKERYIVWYETYIKDKYTVAAKSSHPEKVFLSGEDCYALRCAFLHEGRDDIINQRARQVMGKFVFVVPPESWTIHNNRSGNVLQLQVDIFCLDIARGIQTFLNSSLSQDAVKRMKEGLKIYDIHGNEI